MTKEDIDPMEKRNQPRIPMHSPAKMTKLGVGEHYYGFVEDLSLSGIRIVSPDYIANNPQMSCGFFLENHSKKINPVVSLVYTQKCVESVYAYGFKFVYMSDDDKKIVQQYIAHFNAP